MIRPKANKIVEAAKPATTVPEDQPQRPSDIGWIAVDLDGTLAQYDGWQGPEFIGPPIPVMVNRVKRWLIDGKDVRIFTARITALPDRDVELVTKAINKWSKKFIGQELPVTNLKDHGMIELWDDRAHQVESNTGRIKPEGFIDDPAPESDASQKTGTLIKTTVVTSGSIQNEGLK